jgi:hypothetical protein
MANEPASTFGGLVRRQIVEDKVEVEAGRALNPAAVGGRAKRNLDQDSFSGSTTEVALRLGVGRRTEFHGRDRARIGRP